MFQNVFFTSEPIKLYLIKHDFSEILYFVTDIKGLAASVV